MTGLIKQTKRLAVCGVAAGFFAASTLAFAQDANAPAAQPQQQEQNGNTPDNGWPEAGGAPPTGNAPAANPYGQAPSTPQGSAPSAQQQQPYGQGVYTQQAPNAPQQRNYGPVPYGPQGYPPQGYGQQQGYPQQPYGQGAYSQQQQAPPPIPAQITIPAGTYVTARLNTRLASDRNHPGDAFTATLVEPVVVNGVVVAEPGQTITGQVMEAQKVDGSGRLAVQLTDLPLVDGQRVPIQTQLIARKGDRFRANDAGIVAGSTAAGAVIGSAVGWGTGAAIGAGMGALVSLGAVLTHGHASVLYPEEVLTFRLQQPVTISTSSSAQAFRYVQPGEYDAAPSGPGPYAQTSAMYPAAPAPYYGYGYPAYGYGYPYYWGPSVGFFFGGGPYYRGYYGPRYLGGRYYGGGFHGRR
jgi:hypothetical protein